MRGSNLRKRFFVPVLIVSMVLSMMPFGFAKAQTDDTGTGEPAMTSENIENAGTEDEGNVAETGEELAVEDYDTFISLFEVLEKYGEQYTQNHPKEDLIQLILNYVRTGVERYSGMAWDTFGGVENKDFAAYVSQQDKANNTTVSALKNLKEFTLANGNTVDFGHLFGTMNITYYAGYKQEGSDMGGWAGDICDLLVQSQNEKETDLEKLVQIVRKSYLGQFFEKHSFSQTDIYGDLDAFYVINTYKATQKPLSRIMKEYFTTELSDTNRAAFLLKNRFGDVGTKAGIRAAVYKAYTGNDLIKTLETKDAVNGDGFKLQRQACCYAFADYLYDLAGDDNKPGNEPGEEPTPNPGQQEEPDTPKANDFYDMFSSSTSTLAPGVKQEIKKAITKDEKQLSYYVATVDINRSDLDIYANYKNQSGKTWGLARVTDQMSTAQKKHSNPKDKENYIENYNTVLGTNGDYYNMSTGEPSGALVMEGKEYKGVGNGNFFGILKNGKAVIGGKKEYAQYKEQLKEAIGGGGYLVKDGEIPFTPSANYFKSRASRTCVGITKEGKVVMMVLDGRQEPFSAGGSAEEMAQIMKDAGCVQAINLDGGGSSTFAAKEEGSDSVSVVNRPSDGYERSVSSSLVVVSTAKTSNEFHHALVTTDFDYITKGSTVELTAAGVSESGNAAELPKGVTWKLSDDSAATITGNTLKAKKTGTITVELVQDEKILGSTTIHVVVPDGLTFEKKDMTAVYGEDLPLPLVATYKGNPVKINKDDVTIDLSSDGIGTMDGLTLKVAKDSAVRTVKVQAILADNSQVKAEAGIRFYNQGEAIFDFTKATKGDESLAWTRKISNSDTDDEVVYTVKDPSKEMNLAYVFALDMRKIQVPEQLRDLVKLLPGGDAADAAAWRFLMQLAERVSVLTEVKIDIQFDPNLDVDVSDVKLVNDHFELKDVQLNKKTNHMTAKINWIDQTAAIDPDTANPICIVSGIKGKPKTDASWKDDVLNIKNEGTLSYDIYLRTSTLYNIASQPSFQEQFQVFPFVNPDNPAEKGGHFASQFKEFTDEFTLDKKVKQGWKSNNDNLYYYKDHKALTGIQKVPGYNEEKEYYYEFDEKGICQGKKTGLFTVDGATYYAIKGELKTGWRSVEGKNGKANYYYFDPQTGKAVDGKVKITGYNYIFKHNILIRGDLVTDAHGTHYAWVGEWAHNQWIELDGKQYCAGPPKAGYFYTGLKRVHAPSGDVNEMDYYLFDKNGVWQKNYSGLYTDEKGDMWLIKDGKRVWYPGLVKIGNDYYYFYSASKGIRDRSYWITKHNGLLPEREYKFGKDGKMLNPPDPGETPNPGTEPGQDPQPGDDPAPQVKNGIVAEKGSLYHYEDGKLSRAGLIKIGNDYYYVKTSTGEVVHDRSYWTTKNNDLLPVKSYKFGKDGKMLNPPNPGETPNPGTEPGQDPQPGNDPTPQVKNGIVAEKGSLYYYKNGKIDYAGLIKIGKDYYYVKTSTGEVVHGRKYWISKHNGLLPEKEYTFAKDGKLILK